MNPRTLGWLTRGFTGLLFVVASANKIHDPAGFARAVYNYQMLPHDLVNLTAVLLPWVELVAGLTLLLVPKLRDAAAFLLLLLLVVFTVAIGMNVYRGIDVACGCFSVSRSATRIGWSKVGENVFFIVVAAIAFHTSRPGVAKRATATS